LSTGFCLLNNAAIATVYARVRWGLERVAVVDIDVHFGNGTAELLKDDPRAFFASVHMIYGDENDGIESSSSQGSPQGCGNMNTGSNKVGCNGHIQKKDDGGPVGFYPSLLGML
jgi:acetoin utilization deacetylase AcuC-like enzyme